VIFGHQFAITCFSYLVAGMLALLQLYLKIKKVEFLFCSVA